MAVRSAGGSPRNPCRSIRGRDTLGEYVPTGLERTGPQLLSAAAVNKQTHSVVVNVSAQYGMNKPVRIGYYEETGIDSHSGLPAGIVRFTPTRVLMSPETFTVLWEEELNAKTIRDMPLAKRLDVAITQQINQQIRGSYSVDLFAARGGKVIVSQARPVPDKASFEYIQERLSSLCAAFSTHEGEATEQMLACYAEANALVEQMRLDVARTEGAYELMQVVVEAKLQ